MKRKHWICDCPEGWIYPMEVPFCQHCFLMSPREILARTCRIRSRKYWAKLKLEEKKEIVKKFRWGGKKKV